MNCVSHNVNPEDFQGDLSFNRVRVWSKISHDNSTHSTHFISNYSDSLLGEIMASVLLNAYCGEGPSLCPHPCHPPQEKKTSALWISMNMHRLIVAVA